MAWRLGRLKKPISMTHSNNYKRISTRSSCYCLPTRSCQDLHRGTPWDCAPLWSSNWLKVTLRLPELPPIGQNCLFRMVISGLFWSNPKLKLSKFWSWECVQKSARIIIRAVSHAMKMLMAILPSGFRATRSTWKPIPKKIVRAGSKQSRRSCGSRFRKKRSIKSM